MQFVEDDWIKVVALEVMKPTVATGRGMEGGGVGGVGGGVGGAERMTYSKMYYIGNLLRMKRYILLEVAIKSKHTNLMQHDTESSRIKT